MRRSEITTSSSRIWVSTTTWKPTPIWERRWRPIISISGKRSSRHKIRENPSGYADFIEDSIKYITEIPDKEDESKTKLIFKKKVKVALNRGEIAFHEAAEKLRNMEPLPPLEFNGNICIPLPQNEEELKDHNYLKDQVKVLKENNNIDLYFKDLVKLPDVSALLMVVDDNVKNTGRKRNAILNKDFKYIGINSHFVGKTFLAYFAFSK